MAERSIPTLKMRLTANYLFLSTRRAHYQLGCCGIPWFHVMNASSTSRPQKKGCHCNTPLQIGRLQLSSRNQARGSPTVQCGIQNTFVMLSNGDQNTSQGVFHGPAPHGLADTQVTPSRPTQRVGMILQKTITSTAQQCTAAVDYDGVIIDESPALPSRDRRKAYCRLQ